MLATILPAFFFAAVLAAPQPEIERVQIRQIDRRAPAASTFDINSLYPSACFPPSSILALETSAPTLPADVASALITYTDPCHAPSLTGSIGSAYSSYLSAASSWAKENEPVLESWASYYMTACPLVASASLSVPTIVPSQTMLLSFASCGGSGATGASTGAAPKQTVFAAVGVVAGFAGVVAAL